MFYWLMKYVVIGPIVKAIFRPWIVGRRNIPKTGDKDQDGVIHQGIAKRYFSKVFTIADDVEIEGAELKNGLLKVSLHQIVPENKKPKTITVK